MNCHAGINKTVKLLKSRFLFPNMRKLTAEVIKECRSCFQRKVLDDGKKNTVEPFQTKKIPEGPGSVIVADVAGPFQLTTDGNRFVLAAIDKYTRYLMCVAVPNQRSNTITKAFLEMVVLQHENRKS